MTSGWRRDDRGRWYVEACADRGSQLLRGPTPSAWVMSPESPGQFTPFQPELSGS